MISPAERTAAPARRSRMGVGGHLRRALVGGMHRSAASPDEAARLASIGVSDPLVQGYAVWRLSVLLVAVPFTAVSAVLAVRDLLARDLDGYSPLGVAAAATVSLTVPVLTASVLLAALRWRQLQVSGRLLLAGWAVSMFGPLVVAMLPLDWLVSSSLGEVTGIVVDDDPAELFARAAVSIQYALILLPSLLSFPSGVVRGAARVKRMLPSSTIAGWVLIIMTPIYAVFFVLALILVQHLAGNGVLLGGALLLALGPFVHLRAYRLYIYPLTTADEVRRLDRTQRLAGAVGGAGLALIGVWALTATFFGRRIVGGSDALLDPLGGMLAALELIARVLVTSVVFSNLLLQVTESAWRNDHDQTDPAAYERHGRQMADIGRSLGGAPSNARAEPSTSA